MASEDGHTVFTVGEDGIIFIYKVSEIHTVLDKKKKSIQFTGDDTLNVSNRESIADSAIN